MAVTTSTSSAVQARRSLHVPRPGPGARRFAIGFLIGIVAVLGALIWFSGTLAGRILPGVTAGGVAIGGLAPAEARAALLAALGPLETGRVTVTATGRGALTFDVAEIGRRVEIDAMLTEAATMGRGGTRLDELLTAARLALEPRTIPIQLSYDVARLDALLAGFDERADRPPIGARVIATDDGFQVVPAVEGLRVSTEHAATAVGVAMLDPTTAADAAFAADVVAIEPATRDRDAERARAAADRMARDLVLAHGDRSWRVRPGRIRTWIRFAGVGPAYAPVVDATGIPFVLKNAAKAVAVKPRQATFLRDRGGNVFGVRASAAGKALDRDAAVEGVLAALSARATMTGGNEPVAITTKAVAPTFTTAEATREAPLVVRLGTWTTYYQVSAHNGFAANITVPARRLDGVVVRPGQTFDFWRALGEVSFRTGYRLGGAIVGGHTVEGKALAGGICAASTTLFNAAARSGLQIVTRSPHWYYIKRYPLGLDATVSESQTMRFRNDTRHPVLIRAYASPGVVRFEIWSVPNGRTVTWTKPRVTNVVKGYDTTQLTSSLPTGERERIEWPVDGKDVSITRTVRDGDGRVVHRDTFVSHYHRMVGVTLIGR